MPPFICKPGAGSTLLLAAIAWLAGAAPATAQTPTADTAAAPGDSVAVVDTVLADELGLPVVVLGDSAARAADSAAVADLSDTSEVALPTQAIAGTDVLLRGRRIFSIYGGLGALSAKERASRLGSRLDALAADGAFDPDSLIVVEGESLSTIRFGDLTVMSVTEEDARAQGLGRAQAAGFYAARIRDEVMAIRERSTARVVTRNAAISVGLLALLAALLWLLHRAFRWIDLRLIHLQRRYLRTVTVRGVEVLKGGQIARAGRALVRMVRRVLALLLIYIFVTTILGLFPWTQAWSNLLLGYLVAPVRAVGSAVIGGLPEFFAIVVVVVLVRLGIRLSNAFFHRLEDGSITVPGFYPEFAEPTRKIARVLLVILGIFLAYPYTPIADSPVFQGLTLFLGILFSLGSGSAVANLVAGTLLTYTRAFRIGDRIQIGETTGDVMERTFLVTRLRTTKNEVVAIPNSTALQSSVINYSAMAREGPGLIFHSTVTIGYDVPWATVERLLVEAARRTDGVLDEPDPFVLQTSLGDFSVAYEINAFTRESWRLPALKSDLHRHIQDTFAEAGVEILSPTYEAHRDGQESTVPGASAPAAGDAVTP